VQQGVFIFAQILHLNAISLFINPVPLQIIQR
jgi:hypothetical protein